MEIEYGPSECDKVTRSNSNNGGILKIILILIVILISSAIF